MRARVGHASNGNRALVSSSTLLDVFECPRNGRVCRAVSDKFTALAALSAMMDERFCSVSHDGNVSISFPAMKQKQKEKAQGWRGRERVLPPTSR